MGRNILFENIARIAVESLIEEAMLSPKPGLVDAFDNGSHTDMDIELFKTSAHSMFDGFYNYIDCGYNYTGELTGLLKSIRPLGIKTEKEMFSVTKGVNTHKGANFTFGIILSAIGRYLQSSTEMEFSWDSIYNIFNIGKEMTKDIVKEDFFGIERKTNLTYGEKLYLNHGIKGIRGEAEAGYPNIAQLSMPRLITLKEKGFEKDQIYIEILFLLMSKVDDSNIIARGGIESLNYVKGVAYEFLSAGGIEQDNYIKKINYINVDFKKRNLSPGGSADLLSAVIFLDKLVEYGRK